MINIVRVEFKKALIRTRKHGVLFNPSKQKYCLRPSEYIHTPVICKALPRLLGGVFALYYICLEDVRIFRVTESLWRSIYQFSRRVQR